MRIDPAGAEMTRLQTPQRQEGGRTQLTETAGVHNELPLTPEQESDLVSVVDQMNETAKAMQQNLRFEVVKPNRIVIRVVDSKTGDVIREFPPEALIKTFQEMERLMGLLLDRKV